MMGDLLTIIEPPAERPGTTAGEPDTVNHYAEPDPEPEVGAADFKWSTDDSVIIQEQLAMAVYRNRFGGIVIRQERNGFDDEDQVVVLRDEQAVRVLIAALQRELKGGGR